MGLTIEDRPSDSPFVERIWRAQSEKIDRFISIAVNQWELVVWKQNGHTYLAVRGPETKASTSPVPTDTEFFGILFKPGTFMPHLPASRLVNRSATLPTASNRSFWLQGAAWRIPNYDNADTFVDRLAREGVLVQEPIVDAVLHGHPPDLSLRSIQRRFVYTTGLTYNTIQQVERARHATILLQQGAPILDTVHELGYFDQSHLTKSLKHFIGQTPAQIMDPDKAQQLSFLYKTASF